MRGEFLETPVTWAGVASLVGGCWKDGKLFNPASGVRCLGWRIGRLYRATLVSSFLLLVLSFFLAGVWMNDFLVSYLWFFTTTLQTTRYLKLFISDHKITQVRWWRIRILLVGAAVTGTDRLSSYPFTGVPLAFSSFLLFFIFSFFFFLFPFFLPFYFYFFIFILFC